jgi:hypothetical protein
MNENLDPTSNAYDSEELDLEKKLRPFLLMILQVKTKY